MAGTGAPLDPVIHAQARLRIMATLAQMQQGDELHFPRLRKLLGMTAGNLSVHLSRLEEAGYIHQEKSFAGRTPATYISLTSTGRAAFDRYTADLRRLLEAGSGDFPEEAPGDASGEASEQPA